MSQILSAQPRFSHAEWNVSNKTNYKNAENERRQAERLVDESSRLIDETKERTDNTQQDTKKKLDQRLAAVKFWTTELDNKLDDTVKEIDRLEQFIKRIEKAIESVADPLHITQQCLTNRERRYNIDLVHDDVQRNLIKEAEVYQGILELLQRSLEQAKEQLRLNRKSKYILEKDLKDKMSAKLIDDYCHELKNNSNSLQFNTQAAKIESTSVTPQEWEGYSNDNIELAERERQNSFNVRSMIDGILQQVANDMNKQVDETNNAFDRRIFETRDAKAKLEHHLDKVNQQVRDMEENMAKLEMAMNDKQAPLKVAHTRLGERSQRPNVELCRDPAQYRLISEVSEIERSIAELNSRYADSEKSLQGLLRNKVELEADIETKNNTLFIDESECMLGMRQSIKINAM